MPVWLMAAWAAIDLILSAAAIVLAVVSLRRSS